MMLSFKSPKQNDEFHVELLCIEGSVYLDIIIPTPGHVVVSLTTPFLTVNSNNTK